MSEIKQGYKQTDIGVIPEDWEVEPIGNLLVFKNGLNKAKDFFGYGTPIVNYMDIYSKDSLYSKDIKGKVYLSSSEILRYEVKVGDVFFTRTSETPEEVGMSSVVLECEKNTVFSGFVLRGRPINNKLTNEFKSYCFQTKNVRNSIIQGCTYTTRALTNGTQLSKILIPIPKPKEQTAIATALSDTDALIAALDKKIAKKQQIKQGAMQQLLTGKKRLPGFNGEWVEKIVGSVCVVKRGQMIVSSEFVTGPIPVIAGGMTPAGYHNLSNRNENTITISASGANAGFIGFHKYPIFASDCSTINENENIDIHFIYYTLKLKQEEIYKCQTGGAQPHIHPKDIEPLIFNFPIDKSEQTAIAQILTDMDNEIAQLEKERDKYKELKAGMMQVLLTGKVRLV